MNTTINENPNHEWSPQDPSMARRIKVVLPQFYAALAISAVNLSHAIFEYTIYFTLLPSSTDCEWLLAYYGTVMWIGVLVGGIVAQFTGARAIVMLASATSIVGWITLGCDLTEEVLPQMLPMIGLTWGMMLAPAYVYLAEISQPNMRSVLMSIISLSLSIRSLYFILGIWVSTRITAVVNIAFAVFGLIAMLFLPESPYWLANKGCYYGAELSLAWFRGRTTVENVKTESKAIISNAQNNPTALKLFGQKSIYIAAFIVGYVFVASAFIRIFCGTRTLNTHEKWTYLVSGNFEIKLIVVGITTVLISIAFVVLVGILGKRIMFLISLLGGSIAILVASVAVYLYENQILSTDALSWFVIICSVIAHISLTTGVCTVPLLLNGELFPSKLRNFAAGFGIFCMMISSNQFYIPYFFTGPGPLLILALASIFGFISLLWLFPKNENKSLAEIENSFSVKVPQERIANV